LVVKTGASILAPVYVSQRKAMQELAEEQMVVAYMNDTILKKTGNKVPIWLFGFLY